MDKLTLTIYGEPRTKSNRRFAGRNKEGKPYQFKDPKDAQWEQDVKDEVKVQLGAKGQVRKKFIEDGVTVPVFGSKVALRGAFHFYFSRRPSNRDVQNYFKSICDALEGLVYVNDSQLVSVYGEKYHDKERPRIEVEVWRDEDDGEHS